MAGKKKLEGRVEVEVEDVASVMMLVPLVLLYIIARQLYYKSFWILCSKRTICFRCSLSTVFAWYFWNNIVVEIGIIISCASRRYAAVFPFVNCSEVSAMLMDYFFDLHDVGSLVMVWHCWYCW